MAPWCSRRGRRLAPRTPSKWSSSTRSAATSTPPRPLFDPGADHNRAGFGRLAVSAFFAMAEGSVARYPGVPPQPDGSLTPLGACRRTSARDFDVGASIPTGPRVGPFGRGVRKGGLLSREHPDRTALDRQHVSAGFSGPRACCGSGCDALRAVMEQGSTLLRPSCHRRPLLCVGLGLHLSWVGALRCGNGCGGNRTHLLPRRFYRPLVRPWTSHPCGGPELAVRSPPAASSQGWALVLGSGGLRCRSPALR